MQKNYLIGIFYFIYFLFSGSIIYANKNKDIVHDNIEKVKLFQFVNTDSAAFYLNLLGHNIQGKEKDSVYAEFLFLKGLNISITGDTKLALEYFNNSSCIFDSIQCEYGIAETLLNIGETYYNWGEYDTALAYFKKVNEISKKAALKVLYTVSLNYIGKYYHSMGDLSQSLYYYKKAMDMAKEIKDTVEIMSLYNKIGKHYKTLGKYPKALDCFLHAHRLVTHTNNKIEQATTFNHLGNIYQALKDYPNSMFFHKKALQLRKEVNYKEGVAKSLKNLGEVFVEMQEYDSALVYFDQSYIYCKEVGYAKGLVKNIYGKGLVFEKKGNYLKAIDNYKEALEQSHSIGYAIGESRINLYLASLYKRLGKNDLAIKYCNDGLAIASREDFKSNVSDFYLILSDVYSLKGKYKEALLYYKKHADTKGEIINIETNRKIAELQTEYKVNLKNQENEVLKRENQIKELKIKRKNLFILFSIIISGLLMTLVFIIYGRFLNKKKANVELTELNNHIVLKNKELDTLNKKLRLSKDQQVKLFSIISHELRNPLFWFRNLIQMLSAQIDTLDKNMISKSLNSLNESAANTFHLMDNLLHWSKSQLGNIKFKPEPVDMSVLINENIKLLNQFASCKNISLVFEEEQQVMVHADKEMIKTVIRNLLSNALKYTKENGEIRVLLHLNEQKVSVGVLDNGTGMNDDVLEKLLNGMDKKITMGLNKETGSGLGLILCKDFIEKHNGHLKISSSPGKGSQFWFDLALIG